MFLKDEKIPVTILFSSNKFRKIFTNSIHIIQKIKSDYLGLFYYIFNCCQCAKFGFGLLRKWSGEVLVPQKWLQKSIISSREYQNEIVRNCLNGRDIIWKGISYFMKYLSDRWEQSLLKQNLKCFRVISMNCCHNQHTHPLHTSILP